MNGKLYYPLLNRLLSQDSFVQMPESSQGFNRYSYCLNNPLKYTDPTGEIFGIDDFLFFSIASGAMMGFMNAKMNGTSLLKGTIMGGISSVASYGVLPKTHSPDIYPPLSFVKPIIYFIFVA